MIVKMHAKQPALEQQYQKSTQYFLQRTQEPDVLYLQGELVNIVPMVVDVVEITENDETVLTVYGIVRGEYVRMDQIPKHWLWSVEPVIFTKE